MYSLNDFRAAVLLGDNDVDVFSLLQVPTEPGRGNE